MSEKEDNLKITSNLNKDNLILKQISGSQPQNIELTVAFSQFNETQNPTINDLNVDKINSTQPQVSERYSSQNHANLKKNSSKYSELQEELEEGQEQKWKKSNFYMNTGFLGQIFLIDLFRLLLKAAKESRIYKQFSINNAPQLFPWHYTEHTHKRLQKYLDEDIEKAQKQGKDIVGMNFIWIFLKIFKYQMITIFLLQIVGSSFKMYSSLHIKTLIQSIQKNGVTTQAYIDAVQLNVSMILYVLFYHNTPRLNCMIFSIFRNAFMKALYFKVASLSSHAVKQANVGKLINLVANDLANVENRFNVMLSVITAPYPLIVIFVLVYQNYGLMGLVGLFLMSLTCPIQMLISRYVSPYYEQKSKIIDERVKLTNEIIEGIRLIKMYAWEKAFQKSIQIIKVQEYRKNIIIQALTLVNHSIEFVSSLFGTFITFTLVYYFQDGLNLDLPTIFSTCDQFNYIRNEVISSVGWGISGFFQLKVVLNRMASVINLKNTSMTCVSGENKLENNEDQEVGTVKFEDFTAYWKENNPVLKDINLQINQREIVSIIGKVGAGKTSLLNCILKEVPLYKGNFNYKGKLAYVEQEPYIFNCSIKENITFGKQYDEDLYKKVIKSCCLEEDIKSFDQGDNTQIGERGLNISGGQKARISLARALYSEADIYLLDDPLSAVDAKVAQNLFFDVIKFVSNKATVILTTHQIHFSRYTDRVLIFEDGKIKNDGKYAELENEIKKLSLQLSHNSDDDNENKTKDQDEEDEFLTSQQNNQELNNSQSQQQTIDLQNQDTKEEKIKDIVDQSEKSKKQNSLLSQSQPQQNQEKEVKASFATYKFFYKSSDMPFLIFIILALFAGSEVFFVLYNQALGTIVKEDIPSVLIKLGWIVLAYFIIQLLKNTLAVYYFNNSAFNIHQKMINSLLRATVQFFDVTSSGKILNLFSTDIGIVDTTLLTQAADVFEIIIQIFIFLISIMIMAPYFIIVGILQFITLTSFVYKTKEALFHTKQLDLNMRSPVFTFFNVVVQGVLPIRVYNKQEFFDKQFNVLGDDSLRATWYFCLSSRGFGSFIHLFATIFNSISIFIIITFIKDENKIGQSIVLFMASIEYLQWGVRQAIQVDVAMSSTQRCKNLIEEQSEAELITNYDTETFNVDKNESNIQYLNQKFPQSGQLQFQDVKMRYRKELNLVLKGLTFNIQPGQRIGFVGRTGAGKSSIIQALFRMTEIEDKSKITQSILENDLESNIIGNEGIFIDGHKISNLGLHTLRSAISIIPQVPFVFSGSIRRNLDPLEQYSDIQIEKVLEDIELKDKINQLEHKVLTDMTNTSEIFSTGQKQLICLGRAILKQSKLIVLDEATANCDMLTDELIQKKIRERFTNSTIITIAHRLNTIADYDQIIVIDNGKAVEQGEPYQLLQNKTSIFYQMVAKTGKKNSSLIYKIAQQKHEQNQQTQKEIE
ncbi:hypothetical protein ABPG74_010244 [Tetrahymena malaccensis]